jgi:hypothetical protein
MFIAHYNELQHNQCNPVPNPPYGAQVACSQDNSICRAHQYDGDLQSTEKGNLFCFGSGPIYPIGYNLSGPRLKTVTRKEETSLSVASGGDEDEHQRFRDGFHSGLRSKEQHH